MKYIKTFESFIEIDNTHVYSEFNMGNLSKENIKKVELFIDDLRNVANDNNIKLKLVNTKGVAYVTGDSMIVNGYFDDKSMTLACALGKDISQWLPVLIHESSHMDQFIEKVPEWANNIGLDETDRWVNGKDSADMDLIHKEIQTGINVEIDCEKRAVDKIKKWKLDSIIDTDRYTKAANAYVLFYHWMEKNRRWYEIGNEPYNNEEIVKTMPNNFNIDYTKLDPHIEEVLDKYLK